MSDISTAKNPLELGTEDVGKLLLKYAVPAIIAMTTMSLYNIIDSIFIGHGVGALAISGLALTFPLMNLSAAFGSLVGVGASTLLSVRLGQKDYKSANLILGNTVLLNIILGVLFTIVGLATLEPMLYFFGGSEETVPYAYDFMEIILAGNVITFLFMGLNAVLRSSGQPKQAMYAMIYTVAINTILNPLFIFGFKWGIQGSAIATMTSQAIMLLWQLRFFHSSRSFLHFNKEGMHLKRKIVLDTFSIGLSPFMMNAAACVIVILINQGLQQHGGDLAIGAYGIVNRVVFIFIMIVMGINQGMQPIAGYNYGAKLNGRVLEVLKKTILYGMLVTTTGFALGELFPHAIASVFTNEKELIDLSAKGLRIILAFFPFVGFQMVTANFFQSIGMSGKAIFLSLTRQMIFLVPCLIILPHFYGITGVWSSMPAADLAATIVSWFMLQSQLRKLKKLK